MDLDNLSANLGIKFNNLELLKEALTHRSYLNEFKNRNLQSNERLEFLGDAVLSFVVSAWLFKKFPQFFEGKLTSFRSNLVKTTSLTKVAQKIKVGDYLLLSKGEAKDTGKARQYILANTFEAFLGALYLDQGYEKSKEFVNSNLIKELPVILKQGLHRDAKSAFQEQAQEKVRITPSYKVLKEWGPDHMKHFVMGVFLDNELVAEGEGSSKQEAEEDAAKKGLAAKKWH